MGPIHDHHGGPGPGGVSVDLLEGRSSCRWTQLKVRSITQAAALASCLLYARHWASVFTETGVPVLPFEREMKAQRGLVT